MGCQSKAPPVFVLVVVVVVVVVLLLFCEGEAEGTGRRAKVKRCATNQSKQTNKQKSKHRNKQLLVCVRCAEHKGPPPYLHAVLSDDDNLEDLSETGAHGVNDIHVDGVSGVHHGHQQHFARHHLARLTATVVCGSREDEVWCVCVWGGGVVFAHVGGWGWWGRRQEEQRVGKEDGGAGEGEGKKVEGRGMRCPGSSPKHSFTFCGVATNIGRARVGSC